MQTSSEKRACQNCAGNFTIEPEDFNFYEKIKVPPPTFCWECRAMRRMSFRNFRYLFKRKCDATGKTIFTLMPPEAPMPVYDRDYYMSDLWDPMDYGQDYDFSRPFFEQFKKLFNKVPSANILNRGSVNSDYGAGLDMKNCYMCFDAGFDEDSAYGVTLQKSKQCFDTINCKSSELCYYSINITNCYKTFFSRNCTQCSDVWFSQDCVGCLNCFGCSGLRNQSHYIFNEPYSKEEYNKKIKDLNLDSWNNLQKAREKAEDFWIKSPVRFRHGLKDAGCTGDYIYNSSQIRNCFFVNEAKNCSHSQSIIYDPITDSMDITSSGVGLDMSYETSGCGDGITNTFFAIDTVTSLNSNYIINCRNVTDVFGCIALHNKKYCILNKQYTKEEYFELLPKIKKHMEEMPYVDERGIIYKYGEFFPVDMSPFGFNESQGYEYFFLSKEEIEKMGYKWRLPNKKNYIPNKKSKDLPDTIQETNDEIVEHIIQCMHDENNSHKNFCGMNCVGAFNITNQELQFYRMLNLPLPHLCFNCRHVERISWRNVPNLYKRKCMCDKKHTNHEGNCEVEFETSYGPDRPEIVYCEKCYQQEVY
jgi:hypothetical protein